MTAAKQLFPLEQEATKKTHDRRVQIYSVKRLSRKKMKPVKLSNEYEKVMGVIDSNSNIMAYGSSGSGKSVFVIRLINYLTKIFGKGWYVTYEEGVSLAVQERVKQWDIDSEKLYFAGRVPFDVLCDKVRKNKYRVVVIDSVQYAHFTFTQLIEFREKFKKRNIILIFISFGTGMGKTDGANPLLHACDVKLYFNQGKLTSVSRFMNKVVKKTLFTPEEEESEGALFSNQTQEA